jgi:DNA-binding SARP family transcriptional activator
MHSSARPRAEPARIQSAGHATVLLSLLSGFEVTRAGESVSLPMSAQRVVAYLALHEKPLQRVHVAGTLWVDAREDRAAASLRSALWRLRASGCELVDATPGHLCLSRAVTVDIRQATDLAKRLTDHSNSCDVREAAMLAYAGELLPDWYEDWVLLERERFRQRRLLALEALCERLAEGGDYAGAIEAGLAAVRDEPLRESSHRALIRAHLAEGNSSEALRQYGIFRGMLRNELGLDPSPRMEALLLGVTHQ